MRANRNLGIRPEEERGAERRRVQEPENGIDITRT